MSMRTMSEPAKRLPNRSGPRAGRMAGLLGFGAVALLGGATLSQPAEAAVKLCGDRDQILKRLEQAKAETPQALGLSGDGGIVEVVVSPEGGWTMLLTYPKRPTCVVAVGEAWQMLKIAGEPA
jgi:hypothetical protein